MPPFRLPSRATDDDVLAKHFRGFGDATRLRIIAALRWCGYVATERRGKRVIYRLADDGVGEVVALVRRLALHGSGNGAGPR